MTSEELERVRAGCHVLIDNYVDNLHDDLNDGGVVSEPDTQWRPIDILIMVIQEPADPDDDR